MGVICDNCMRNNSNNRTAQKQQNKMNLADETIWQAMMHKFSYYRDKSNAYDRVPTQIDKMYGYDGNDWLLGDREAKG